ncbi:MAG: hypothetical protein QOG82_1726 [Actinomycetota bacterium]|jgi:hypothetical protein|nr:hypothetical protein [Actinomycetota bacterium]
MAVDRRVVRVSPAFFDQLDAQLDSDRGSAGEPSATDFLVIDLPPIVDRFATDFEALPEVVPGVPAARVLVATGRLVRAVAVYGILAADDSIDLIGVELDP